MQPRSGQGGPNGRAGRSAPQQQPKAAPSTVSQPQRASAGAQPAAAWAPSPRSRPMQNAHSTSSVAKQAHSKPQQPDQQVVKGMEPVRYAASPPRHRTPVAPPPAQQQQQQQEAAASVLPQVPTNAVPQVVIVPGRRRRTTLHVQMQASSGSAQPTAGLQQQVWPIHHHHHQPQQQRGDQQRQGQQQPQQPQQPQHRPRRHSTAMGAARDSPALRPVGAPASPAPAVMTGSMAASSSSSSSIKLSASGPASSGGHGGSSAVLPLSPVRQARQRRRNVAAAAATAVAAAAAAATAAGQAAASSSALSRTRSSSNEAMTDAYGRVAGGRSMRSLSATKQLQRQHCEASEGAVAVLLKRSHPSVLSAACIGSSQDSSSARVSGAGTLNSQHYIASSAGMHMQDRGQDRAVSQPPLSSEVAPCMWVCVHQEQPLPSCPAHLYLVRSSTLEPSTGSSTGAARDSDTPSLQDQVQDHGQRFDLLASRSGVVGAKAGALGPSMRSPAPCLPAGSSQPLPQLLEQLCGSRAPDATLSGVTFANCGQRCGPWHLYQVHIQQGDFGPQPEDVLFPSCLVLDPTAHSGSNGSRTASNGNGNGGSSSSAGNGLDRLLAPGQQAGVRPWVQQGNDEPRALFNASNLQQLGLWLADPTPQRLYDHLYNLATLWLRRDGLSPQLPAPDSPAASGVPGGVGSVGSVGSVSSLDEEVCECGKDAALQHELWWAQAYERLGLGRVAGTSASPGLPASFLDFQKQSAFEGQASNAGVATCDSASAGPYDIWAGPTAGALGGFRPAGGTSANGPDASFPRPLGSSGSDGVERLPCMSTAALAEPEGLQGLIVPPSSQSSQQQQQQQQQQQGSVQGRWPSGQWCHSRLQQTWGATALVRLGFTRRHVAQFILRLQDALSV